MFSRDQVLALMRERVHHPAGMRELLQAAQGSARRTTRRRSSGTSSRSSRPASSFRFAGNRFGLPEKMDLYVGRLQTQPGRLRLRHARAAARAAGGDIYIPGHAPRRSDARRPRRRPHRADQGRRPRRRAHHPHPRARATSSLVGRYDRDDSGMGYVVPFDRRVLMDIFVPPGQEGGAAPGEMVIVELTRWPTATRGAIGRVAEVLGDIDAPGVDTEIIIRKYGIPDAHSRRGDRRSDPARHARSRRRTSAAAPTSATCRPSRSTASTRATSTMRSRSRSCRTATSGSACTSPTSRTTCRRAARSIARPTSAARRSISPSAPCTCFRRSWRPGCAASIRTSIGWCSRASWRSIAAARSCGTSSTTASSTATSG